MARMSAASAWSYTATATVWPRLGADAWGGVETFGAPFAIACDYSAKAQTRTDTRGREFVSRLQVFTERADIKPGDRILIGASTLSSPIAAGADEVRAVQRYGDTFDRKADDFVVVA